MSEQKKRYTAQEMREMAFKVQPAPNMPDREYKRRSEVEAMLRQAADDAEENEKLRETINADSASMAGKDAVIERLKARLEAVVKECEKIVEQTFLHQLQESMQNGERYSRV